MIQRSHTNAPVEIIDFAPAHQEAFKRLNVEWIEQHWTLEEADRLALDHPDRYILEPGGHILLALLDTEVVGTCALIKLSPSRYELAKMAVTEKAKGNGIGWLLANATIEKARMLSAHTVYLESNTILRPAINLYRKLGFEPVSGDPSPYDRCNIQMELVLIR